MVQPNYTTNFQEKVAAEEEAEPERTTTTAVPPPPPLAMEGPWKDLEGPRRTLEGPGALRRLGAGWLSVNNHGVWAHRLFC